MKLKEAYICLDCEEIQRIKDYDKDFQMVRCLCSSKKVVPLNQWLYRQRVAVSHQTKTDYPKVVNTTKFG